MSSGVVVVVVGCGVVGLTTAVLLQSRGHKVTIVARATPDPKYWDTDPMYASREAGAHWCSIAAHDDPVMQDYEATSMRVFQQLCKMPETGVMACRARFVWKGGPDKVRVPWYSRVVNNFAPMDREELPEGAGCGFAFETLTFNVVKYMRWLLAEYRKLGGRLIVRSLRHIDEAVHICPDAAAIVNCTGYGARFLGGVNDLDVYPVRGQTVLCKLPPQDTICRMSADEEHNTEGTYIIPRDDGTVLLGGTLEVYNANTTPSPKVAAGIIERCSKLSPSLAAAGDNLEIIRHGVGLRPQRVNGIRIEAERRCIDGRPDVLVVHNYGHGACGYQSSWGSCNAAVSLLERESGFTPVSAKL